MIHIEQNTHCDTQGDTAPIPAQIGALLEVSRQTAARIRHILDTGAPLPEGVEDILHIALCDTEKWRGLLTDALDGEA